MRYIIGAVIIALLLCTMAVVGFILGAADYDLRWDEHQEAEDHDDAG